MKKGIAFFDFDGTVTNKDSLEEFIKFSLGTQNYYKGLLLLSPLLVGYKLGIFSNSYAKGKLIYHFFKGWDIISFRETAERYSKTEIDKIVRKKAHNRIQWHLEQNHEVVIVSASLGCWLKPWCAKNGLELISTTLKIDNKSNISSEFNGKNCHGRQKVKRILDTYNLSDFQKVYAYGDSKGDKPMLELADESFYKPFI